MVFEWLNGEDLPKKFNSENLFHSFMLSNTFNENLVKKININDYKCEYKWDGIRATNNNIGFWKNLLKKW